MVTQFNIGRQLFYQADIGLSKAICLVGRVNMAYGTNWRAVSEDFRKAGDSFYGVSGMRPDIVISCVDTASARRDLHQALWNSGRYSGVDYWLDCGNLATVGQVVLGQPGQDVEDRWPRNKIFDPLMVRWKGQRQEQIRDHNGRFDYVVMKEDIELRLPCVTELFPDLMDENFDETNEPSCSMVDALTKQSLFVNRMVSAYALDLLWELIREGKVDNQGCYFNLRSRTSQPIGLKVWPVQGKRRVQLPVRCLKVNAKKEAA